MRKIVALLMTFLLLSFQGLAQHYEPRDEARGRVADDIREMHERDLAIARADARKNHFTPPDAKSLSKLTGITKFRAFQSTIHDWYYQNQDFVRKQLNLSHGNQAEIAVVKNSLSTQVMDGALYFPALFGDTSNSVSGRGSGMNSPKFIDIVNLLPHDGTGFQSVFHKDPSASDVAQMRRARKILNDADRTAQGLGWSIRKSPAKFVVVIGHANGKLLMQPDGTTADIEELAADCNLWGKICIFLACRSKRSTQSKAVGITYDIAMVSAARLAVSIGTIVAKSPTNAHGFIIDPTTTAYKILGTIDRRHALNAVIGKETPSFIAVALVISIVCVVGDVCQIDKPTEPHHS